jgi:hypothetical protein
MPDSSPMKVEVPPPARAIRAMQWTTCMTLPTEV